MTATSRTKDSAPSYPSLMPDRKTLVFGITLSDASNFGSDVWSVSIDGTNLKTLIQHDRENVFYDTPLIDPTGKVMYVHRRAAIVQNNTYVGNDDSLERVDLATGKMTRVVSDAAARLLALGSPPPPMPTSLAVSAIFSIANTSVTYFHAASAVAAGVGVPRDAGRP